MEVLNQFNLLNAKSVLITPDFDLENHIKLEELPKNIKVIENAKHALNKILQQSLNEFVDSATVKSFINLCFDTIERMCSINNTM